MELDLVLALQEELKVLLQLFQLYHQLVVAEVVLFRVLRVENKKVVMEDLAEVLEVMILLVLLLDQVIRLQLIHHKEKMVEDQFLLVIEVLAEVVLLK